jgi:hypothetical protein
MYVVPVEIRKSAMDGKGVFTKTTISKVTIVWQYTEGHDMKMTRLEFDGLVEPTKVMLQRVAYLSPNTDMWVMPPKDDPACLTNHAPDSYNTSIVIDRNISDESVFIENRDVPAGEEITNNYLEFDVNSTKEELDWLNI